MTVGLKVREPRQKVMVPARMRVGGAYVDVCIRNISSRGMMLQTASPPPPGTYIEILRAAQVVVARIVWKKDRRFGIRTSDRMDIAAIISQTAPEGPRLPDQERRSPDRSRVAVAGPHQLAEQAERSRRISRAFEFGLLVVCGAVGAALLADTAYGVLSRPLKSVTAHLR